VSAAPSIQKVCSGVAAILKRKRLAKKLSLTRLAEKAGLSRQMVSYVERGLRVPGLDTLLRICKVLGLDAADVLRRAQKWKQ
jgi:transcriptional regulator with XRE-family HTH domain